MGIPGKSTEHGITSYKTRNKPSDQGWKMQPSRRKRIPSTGKSQRWFPFSLLVSQEHQASQPQHSCRGLYSIPCRVCDCSVTVSRCELFLADSVSHVLMMTLTPLALPYGVHMAPSSVWLWRVLHTLTLGHV